MNGAPVDVAELHAPVLAPGAASSVEALGLGDDVDVNPSGGALAANPMMVRRPHPDRRGGPRHRRAGRHRALAHATSGPCLQQNLVCVLEGD